MDIFPYNDGIRDRFGDPYKIERIMESYCQGSIANSLQQTKSENPQISNPAWDQLMDAVCVAFQLVPFDAASGRGTNEGFQLELWEKFLEWKSKKKANIDSPPNSPTGTAGAPLSGRAPSPRTPVQQKSNTVSGSTSP